MEEDDSIREVSFSNLNYAVTVKSSYQGDTLEKLKKTAFDVLKVICNEKERE